MRVTCAAPRESANPELIDCIRDLGVEPIVTNKVIRAVYEGDNKKVGEAIVYLFADERDHEIYVDYEQKKLTAKEKRILAFQTG